MLSPELPARVNGGFHIPCWEDNILYLLHDMVHFINGHTRLYFRGNGYLALVISAIISTRRNLAGHEEGEQKEALQMPAMISPSCSEALS